ncbi:MAG: HEAT repeat domain-containing protein [Bacteroidia bacterium]|nr:HEAT repeat domain-containing protein [Bacteroidia bacterium]
MKLYPLSVAIIAVASCLLLACTSRHEESNIFVDPDLVRIADYQDKRATDSLLPYLTHENALYRERAAFAFASVQDSAAVGVLTRCLHDPVSSVRKAAALALGQTSSSLAGDALATSFLTEKDSATLQTMLEGYGKQKSASLAAATAYADQPGFAWMLYRMALAGNTDSTVTTWAVRCLQPGKPEAMRLGAAHFFARTRAVIDSARNVLLQSCTDPLPEVRMASVLALRKIKGEQVLAALKNLAEQEQDYRVRVSIVRALQPVPLDQSRSILLPMLKDANVNVGIAVSELIQTAITKGTADAVWEAAQQIDNVRIKANLYGTVLATTQDPAVAQQIQQACQAATNAYDQASWLAALSAFPPLRIVATSC